MTPTSPRRRALGALIAVLSCAGLLVAAPTSAGAAPADPSARLVALQLGPLPAVVAHRRVLTLQVSGALPGATVSFFRTPAGGEQQALRTRTATMDGTATLAVPARSTATYVASMNLGTPITSNTRTVGVTRRLGFARTVVDADRRTVRFTATVSTGNAPGTLVLQRRRGDRWATVGSWPAGARNVRTVVVPRGRTVHRVVVRATRAYRTSVSRTVAVRLG